MKNSGYDETQPEDVGAADAAAQTAQAAGSDDEAGEDAGASEPSDSEE